MPELPEVETIARGVNRRVQGDRIAEVWFSGYPQPFKTPPAEQRDGLLGRSILSVHRTGKHVVCELGSTTPSSPGGARRRLKTKSRSAVKSEVLDPEAQWIVHLGMTGRLLIATPDSPVEKHTHARLTLLSGKELRFVDPRRFGRLEYRDLSAGGGFLGPGAEPLTIESEAFAALFLGRTLVIKAALLNQSLLAGVGNIYADESLFRAGVRPRKRTGALTRAELERLRMALRDVLRQAIRKGGSSVSDYVDADGERGFFQLEHCVYRRTGEPCRVCGTAIRRIIVAGRGTHYCPSCQR
jgi:formamidopyrimidine-DNA glycosylase